MSAPAMSLEPKDARPVYLRGAGFAAFHVLVLVGLFLVPLKLEYFIWGAVLFVVRMWGVTAGYHRYFSHRSFKTGRVFQFILAVVATSSSQKGVLWWAAHHRQHHKRSDQEGDPHSPIHVGIWRSHMTWIFERANYKVDLARVGDLSRYPELVWLDRNWWVPPAALAAVVTAAFGLGGLVVTYGLSTILLWQGTFLVNSVCHIFGRRRFETTDDSRNNWWVALVTLGEGWHNNHHHLPASARMGLAWYELDLTWWSILGLEWAGVVTDVRLTDPSSRRVTVRRGRDWLSRWRR